MYASFDSIFYCLQQQESQEIQFSLPRKTGEERQSCFSQHSRAQNLSQGHRAENEISGVGKKVLSHSKTSAFPLYSETRAHLSLPGLHLYVPGVSINSRELKNPY